MAKGKNIIPFMALRNCFRNKNNFVVFICGISISIALIMISSSINNKLIKTQQENTKQVTGDWHMAFLYDDASVLHDIEEIDEIKQVFQCFYISELYSEDKGECFQILAINKEKMNDFIKICKGEYPKNELEVILPQWYLDKHMISNLPYEIVLDGKKMSVVGAFETEYEKTSSRIPLYMAYEENKEFEKYSELQLPWGSMLESEKSDNQPLAQRIVLVSLRRNSNLNKIENAIENIDGVFPFPLKEAYEITEYSKEYTAWFNGELISVENLRNAGALSQEGTYAVQRKISYIYELIIVGVTILFMITLINLKKGDILFQVGILRTMGIDFLEVIAIGLLYFVLVIAFALPIGVALGSVTSVLLNLFQYIEIVSIGTNIAIVAIGFILTGVLVIGYAVLVNPALAISEGTSDIVMSSGTVKSSRTIKNKHGFKLRYVLRNMSLHKNRYIVMTAIVSLIFTLFVICFTIINLSYITQNGKSKYEYDILIKKENGENYVDDTALIATIQQIEGVEEILAPLCYNVSYMDEEQSQEIIVKIPKEKLGDVLKQKILLSNYESYVKNDHSYVMNNTGIIGCNTQELNYLKQHIVEGDIEKMYDASQAYVLLPKYFESYEKSDIAMTKYKVGDTIEICLTKENTNLLNPEFASTQTFIIAGFVDINPFYMSNGVSSEFSVIVNAAQFQKIIPGTMTYIYMKTNHNMHQTVENQLNILALEKNGYCIRNANEDTFLAKINQKRENDQNEMMLVIVLGTSIIIVLGLANLIFVKKMLRKDEIKLLRIIGMSAKVVRGIDVIETILYNMIGIAFGVIISLVILNRLKLDVIYTRICNVPWGIWGAVAVFILTISVVFSVITSIYIEKQLNID